LLEPDIYQQLGVAITGQVDFIVVPQRLPESPSIYRDNIEFRSLPNLIRSTNMRIQTRSKASINTKQQQPLPSHELLGAWNLDSDIPILAYLTAAIGPLSRSKPWPLPVVEQLPPFNFWVIGPKTQTGSRLSPPFGNASKRQWRSSARKSMSNRKNKPASP
jgi:hypothetical protein